MSISRHKIRQGVVTQSDIARHCQVSIMTVSRALRGEACVTPETTARIRAAAEELGYNPAHHIAARRLALRKSGQRVVNHLIATLFPREVRRVHYNAMLFDGIVDELAEQGYMMVTAVSPNPLEAQYPHGIPPLFSCGEIDGIIVNPGAKISQEFINGLREQPYFGDRTIVSLIYPTAGCSHILVDGEQGGYLATRHLLEYGHRYIMRFDVPGSITQNNRLQGVLRAYREAGLDPDVYLHSVPIPPHWPEPTTRWSECEDDVALHDTDNRAQACADYVTAHPEITGILASNDCCAMQVWYMLQRMGKSVPNDVSLIGFDDTDPLLNKQGVNILTTIRLPLEEVGREAARLVIRQVESGEMENVEITLPTELVIRHSTGPVREPVTI